MADRKTLDSFGPEYEQLLLRAHTELNSPTNVALEFTVQFADVKVSSSVQMKFREYLRVLRRSSQRPDLVAISMPISTRVAGAALVFFRRENSVDAIAIRHALGLADGFADNGGGDVLAPQSGHTDAVSRLRQMREAKKPSK